MLVQGEVVAFIFADIGGAQAKYLNDFNRKKYYKELTLYSHCEQYHILAGT
jgi:hypothetical protein